MNQFSDEVVMAYADGELDGPQRADLEKAVAVDAALAGRVRVQRDLRDRVRSAYRPVLDEPMPARLMQTVQATPAPLQADVVNLEDVRRARDIERASLRAQKWARWGGMAASLLLGLAVGMLIKAGDGAIVAESADGKLIAHGAVDQALSTQSASAANGKAAVQISFVDRSGDYCRTFTAATTAGLACRQGHVWVVQLLVQTQSMSTPMRQAASALPMAILQAVDQRIQGSPLDAASEQAALRQGWQR